MVGKEIVDTLQKLILGGGSGMKITMSYPFTPPKVTPPTIYLERIR